MKRLRDLRISRKLTQNDVANYLGISRSAYTNIENGKRDPDTDTLKKLATFFRTTVDDILGISNCENIDKQDIAEELERIQQMLENQDHLMFDGSPMSQDAKSYILSAMRIGMAAAKQKKQDTDEKKNSKEVKK